MVDYVRGTLARANPSLLSDCHTDAWFVAETMRFQVNVAVPLRETGIMLFIRHQHWQTVSNICSHLQYIQST